MVLDGCGTLNNARRTTLVTLSEFCRRMQENASEGMDHGHASTMLVLGGGINGGRIYGQWPGLRSDQLCQTADLAFTNDYRTLLSEVLTTLLANGHLDKVFPGIVRPIALGLAAVCDVKYPCTAPSQEFKPGIRR